MTQPATEPAPADEPEEKMESVVDLINAIVTASGVNPDDIEDLPTGRRLVTGNGKIWETTKGVPGRDKELLIIGMFDADDYVSIYAVPMPDSGDHVVFSRFRVHMPSGACFTQTLSLDTIIEEMAEELADLYGVVSNKLRVDCEVETCGASNEGNANFCSECGKPMPKDEDEPEFRGGPPPPPPS